MILPGRQSIGILMTCLVGVAGAFVGGLLSSAILGVPATDPSNVEAATWWPGWLTSIIGAVLVLILYVKVINPRTDTLVDR